MSKFVRNGRKKPKRICEEMVGKKPKRKTKNIGQKQKEL